MKEYEIFNFDENMTNNFVFMNTVEDSYYFIEEIYNDLYKTRGSHGCINLQLEDVKNIYNLVSMRDMVFIHE